MRARDHRQTILSHFSRHPQTGSAPLVGITGLSRQRVAALLTAMVHEGILARTGSTKNALYHVAGVGETPRPQSIELIRSLKALEEDKVFDEIDLRLRLKKQLHDNVYRIVYYAFTEMLNNAIEHSAANDAKIRLALEKGLVTFTVRDHGVGAFANVCQKFGLKKEFDGLEHLLKGKQTTAPREHSGQGVFFTSRIADKFTLRSHKLALIVDNKADDIFVAEQRNLKGTEVSFEILTRSRKQLKQIFDEFSNDDYEFDRTNFRVRLSADREYLSRSQAKRILLGLEKFDKIVFDFSRVKMIGQGFADEIFRVYQRRQPQIEITFSNANEAVTGMILRAIRG